MLLMAANGHSHSSHHHHPTGMLASGSMHDDDSGPPSPMVAAAMLRARLQAAGLPYGKPSTMRLMQQQHQVAGLSQSDGDGMGL